jgi:hemoglobin
VSQAEAATRDLATRTDVHDLVVDFYREVAMDDLLGPVFNEVAEVDWAAHIPRLIDFWCRVLLGQPGYDGFLLGPHQAVHQLQAFAPAMFDRWYLLFAEAVDRQWVGPVAEQAKDHARKVAGILARRLLDLDWQPPG